MWGQQCPPEQLQIANTVTSTWRYNNSAPAEVHREHQIQHICNQRKPSIKWQYAKTYSCNPKGLPAQCIAFTAMPHQNVQTWARENTSRTWTLRNDVHCWFQWHPPHKIAFFSHILQDTSSACQHNPSATHSEFLLTIVVQLALDPPVQLIFSSPSPCETERLRNAWLSMKVDLVIPTRKYMVLR